MKKSKKKENSDVLAGAKEFWVRNEKEEVTFFDDKGRIEQSGLVPGFPARVHILS